VSSGGGRHSESPGPSSGRRMLTTCLFVKLRLKPPPFVGPRLQRNKYLGDFPFGSAGESWWTAFPRVHLACRMRLVSLSVFGGRPANCWNYVPGERKMSVSLVTDLREDEQ